MLPDSAASALITNSVYPTRRDASRVQRPQTRRMNRVGLSRRPEPVQVGGIGVCKLCARMHAQIMTGDLPRGLICAIDFASIAWPNECAARPRAIQARTYGHPARTRKARHRLARCSEFGFSTRVLDADDAEQSSCRQLADSNAARRNLISLN